MAYIGQNADGNFTTSVSKDTFSGNGSTTAFTLSEGATTNTVDVFVENIRQEPTTAYTVDGTTLTFTAAPVSGTDNIYVVNRGPIQLSASHPAAQALTAHSATITTDLTVDTDTLYVDSTNNRVGVGTVSPEEALHVYNATSNINAVIESGDANAYLAFKDNSTTGYAHVFLGASGNDMTFFSGGSSERMRLDSSGNLLIGSDSGDAFNADSMLRIQRTGDRVFQQFKCDADQNVQILFGDVDDAVECAIQYHPSDKDLRFTTGNNSEAIRIDSSGNVGIGSTVPKGRLTIQKDQAGSSTSGTGTTLTFNGNAGSGNPWEIYRDNGTTGDLVFCQDVSNTRSEAIRIRLAGGGITFNGDTAEANALDDYEEGTFTPGITGMTFSTAEGVYTKIGRRVHCSGIISNCTSGTASAVAAKLSGLPFTVSNSLSGTSLEDGGLFQYWANLGVTASVVTIAPDDSSTECLLYYADGSGSTTLNSLLRTAVDATNFNCRFSFTYIST